VAVLFCLWAAADEAVKPIPQDAAKQQQRWCDRLEWNQRTIGGCYDKLRNKVPCRDKLGRAALEALVRNLNKEHAGFHP
jgi:hypothetical protein